MLKPYTALQHPRQVVKDSDVVRNRKYDDLLYSYLQSISRIDGGTRYVTKQDVSQSRLATKFGVSRNTITNRINGLIALGLLERGPCGRLILRRLERKEATILPKDLIEVLVDTLTPDVINTYGFLFNLYYANKQQACDFTISQILAHVGIQKTEAGYNKVSNILIILNNLGLIKTHIYYKEINNGIKRPVHRLTNLNNTLDTSCEQLPDAGGALVINEIDEDFDSLMF